MTTEVFMTTTPANMIDPALIVSANGLLNLLNSALAADLAITADPHAMVHISVRSAAMNNEIRVYVPAKDIDPFLTNLIQETLQQLNDKGIDTAGILQTYKETAEKLLSKSTVQNPT